ncbi:MAG: response regulator [Ignavibacteriales bacterium]|nr:response regulator [Ignavibacteriales bacterium]
MDKILVVDDEQGIVQIMSIFLQDEGYETVGAFDGVEAQGIIEQRSDEFSAIVLDWTMPRMSGIELLKWMKENDRYENIPVIMQTAKMSPEDIKEGIDAGAFYYLTKPIQKDLLLSILKAAVTDLQYKRSLIQKIKEGDNPFGFLYDATFRVRSLGEAEYLASRLANATSSANNALGISEMLINAIEHGNLGISYGDKTALVAEGTWRSEVDRRLRLPENANKFVHVTLKRNDVKLTLLIEDQGPGFDWAKYLSMDEIRVFDNHGRGIAITREYIELQFFPPGNKVLLTISLQ